MINCGAPMPAPTYGLSEPELYQSTVRSPESLATPANAAR
jgi:hypothetical protein